MKRALGGERHHPPYARASAAIGGRLWAYPMSARGSTTRDGVTWSLRSEVPKLFCCVDEFGEIEVVLHSSLGLQLYQVQLI